MKAELINGIAMNNDEELVFAVYDDFETFTITVDENNLVRGDLDHETLELFEQAFRDKFDISNHDTFTFFF
jgi:hypothetical protein